MAPCCPTGKCCDAHVVATLPRLPLSSGDHGGAHSNSRPPYGSRQPTTSRSKPEWIQEGRVWDDASFLEFKTPSTASNSSVKGPAPADIDNNHRLWTRPLSCWSVDSRATALDDEPAADWNPFERNDRPSAFFLSHSK